MAESWKYLFSPVILERGRDYFYGGDIDHIEKTADGWKAEAHGTDDYEVRIRYKGNRIESMECTCPYAADGRHCKHMAGLLYALHYTGFREEPENEQTETLEEILDRMNEEQLREELGSILREEARYRDRIVRKYTSLPADRNVVEHIAAELDSLSDVYGDHYGFIDWRSGGDYADAFKTCLEDNLEPMIVRGEYRAAFEVLKEAFYILNTVEMDGSNGEHGEIAAVIEAFWEKIIRLSPENERDRMHDWFAEMKEISDNLNCGDSIDTALEYFFDDEKYILPMLEEIRKDLDENADEMSEYELKSCLHKYEDLLKRIHADLSEYEAWLDGHGERKAVKEIRLEQMREKNERLAAAAILEDLYRMETDRWDRARQLRELIGLYTALDDTEKLKDALKRMLFDCESKSTEYLYQYEDLCEKEDWPMEREAYLAKHRDLKPQVYLHDGEYGLLMDSLKEQDITVVDTYREKLKDLYPEELLKIYMRHLRRLEMRHPNNSTYREMERYLLYTADIPGSVEVVCSLIDEWTNTYPTRKGMLRMLSQVRRQITV